MHCLVFLEHSIPAFRISDELLEGLARRFPNHAFERVIDNDNALDRLPDADLLITWKMESAWYRSAPKLQALFTPAAGRDWVAEDPLGRVRVFHGSFHGTIMAETLLAMVLHFNRRIHHAMRLQRDHVWERAGFSDASRLSGQKIVIIGYGTIGRTCARLLKTLGCGTIIGVRRHLQRTEQDKDADRICSMQELLEVLPEADHVVAILPGGPQTEGIVTAQHFSSMRPSAFFYNLGRGNCYDELVLVNALRDKVIAGAGLDVFSQEPLPLESSLWDLPNVLILPHVSAMGPDYLPLFLKQVVHWIETLS